MNNRELDAKMAELMGWHKIKDSLAPKGTTSYRYVNRDWLGNEIKLPYFSTDISAAMLVVEKMRQDDFWWSASYKETYVEGTYQAGYSVTFRCVRAGIRGSHTATALTLPLAICRAALKAVEEK